MIFLDKAGHVEDVDIPDFSMESIYRWQAGKKEPAFPVFNGRAFYEVTCDSVSDAIMDQQSPERKRCKEK